MPQTQNQDITTEDPLSRHILVGRQAASGLKTKGTSKLITSGLALVSICAFSGRKKPDIKY
jgi:hypothetical protein